MEEEKEEEGGRNEIYLFRHFGTRAGVAAE